MDQSEPAEQTANKKDAVRRAQAYGPRMAKCIQIVITENCNERNTKFLLRATCAWEVGECLLKGRWPMCVNSDIVVRCYRSSFQSEK